MQLFNQVTHYNPRSGFLYYNLTAPPRGFRLSTTWGRAEQLCGFEPWKLSLVLSKYILKLNKCLVQVRIVLKQFILFGT
jgi:hypothetical protein